MESLHPVLLGTIASGAASLGTTVGALLIFLVRGLQDWTEDVLLSGAAGVMLAASFISLLQPGIDWGVERYANEAVAVGVVVAGLLGGGLVLWLIHRSVPHEHFHTGREGPGSIKLARLWLFVIAITLHNFPEGMAVGVAAAGGDLGTGAALTLAIGVQNLPEGLAVATSLLAAGYGRGGAALIAIATGFVEPVGGLIGASAAWLASALLPAVLGFAAGAMLYVISDEIIPETHRDGHATLATASLLAGVALMLVIGVLLG